MDECDVVEIAVPRVAAELKLFDRVDYEDAFRTQTWTPRTSEQLMRDVFEEAPDWFLHAWSTVLGKGIFGRGLDLEQRPDRVVGWKVVADTGEVFATGVDLPRGLHARLFAIASPSEEIVGTQIRLNSAYARAWWPAVRAGHRYFLPYLFRRSAERARRRHSLAHPQGLAP
ncbi:MAG: hypothetical protein ACJ71Z_12250 [Aeromicrobium sp.]